MSCSAVQTRPVQEMSDTAAAIRAAKEVQADNLVPELYRQANEWFFKAKREYKFKNFAQAKDYAERARRFAEQAEFDALRTGVNRAEAPPPPEPAAQPTYNYDSPRGKMLPETSDQSAQPKDANPPPPQ